VNNLKKILLAAFKSNLEYVDLSYITVIGGALNLEPNSLPSLERIALVDCHLSVESMENILSAAPNLTEYCKSKINSQIASLKQSEQSGISPVLNSQTQPSLSNPKHDPTAMSTFKPTSHDMPFVFTGTKNTKDQGMLIEKLSQYFTLKQTHLDVIPKIQDGMCCALSHYFSTLDKTEWDSFIDNALAWNGKAPLNDSLVQHFNALYDHVKTYQLQAQPITHYVGDGLADFLATNTACVLYNPCHAIAIKPAENGRWFVYDPNYLTGCLQVPTEKLLSTIHNAIGDVVSVEAHVAKPAFKIENPDSFIAHGGLLALCQCDNASDMLSQLSIGHSYSKDALDGLMLRSTSGKPAWVHGIENNNLAIRALTHALKKQFELQHGEEAIQQLLRSMEALTPLQKGECITRIIQSDPNNLTRESRDPLIEAIRVSVNKAQYEEKLRTWDKKASSVSSVLHYAQLCLNKEVTKRLIELNSTQHVDVLSAQLQQYATNIHRPVFYVDSPNDLICSATWMQKNQNNTGVLCNGPGGALYDFLQTNKDNDPLLIVNYERFNADDMVRFNGLLDKEPNADGTALPAGTQIIGLMNRNKPDCYQGSDFYSRFKCTEICPLSNPQLDDIRPKRQVGVSTELSESTTIINLYHAQDWQERLLGRWVLDGDALIFEEGELVKAIAAGKPIEIQNGLWGNEAFERFWQQVLSGGYRQAERMITLPDHIELSRPETDVYDWTGLKQAVSIIKNGLSDDGASNALNLTLLSDFFSRHDVEGDKLIQKPGLIEEAKIQSRSLDVNVTRTLTDDAWAMLLNECRNHDVKINVHCAPGVELPVAFSHPSTIRPAPNVTTTQNDLVITSSDVDTSVAMMTHDSDKNWNVIDVSECSPADLLVRLDGKFNKDDRRFEFSQTDGALISALAQQKNIVLKGFFSPELMDALAPVLLERSRTKENNSQIILITDDSNGFPYVSNHVHQEITSKDKKSFLPNEGAELKDGLIEKETLSQLQARCRFLALNPAGNSDDAYIGMKSLPTDSMQALTQPLDRTRSADECTKFTQARVQQVNDVLKLKAAPYVFLTGLSGVGKTTFVEKELCNNDNLYLTEDRIQDWVNDTSDKRKILFLDEANLSPRLWSEFEGLFNTPPTILVNGVLSQLTENHKVIFAGNPVNYGDERKLAPFFQRHGNAVLFKPLPPAVIYEKILKPVYEGADASMDRISDRILDVYRFVCDCSTTEVLISPRELQMMALLTLTRAKEYPEQDINAIAAHFSHALARNLIPAEKQAEFDRQFKPAMTATPTIDSNQDGNFFITSSRQVLSQQLNDLLNLRTWRRTLDGELNSTQKGGGLGGIIIEGEPGIGKSELVKAALVAHHYTQEHDFKTPSKAENPFYIMPVSMSLSEKEDLLIKAFNEGAVVIIDEMNSSPMMERLLNDLLMGKNPRSTDNTDVKPGFMVIGTQNPVTMAGRRVASTALQRRVITTVLPEYTPDELKVILQAKGINAVEAVSMVEAYEANRAYAIKKGLSPVPNFRNLIDLANDHMTAHNRLTNSDKPMPDKPIPTNPATNSRINPIWSFIMNALDRIISLFLLLEFSWKQTTKNKNIEMKNRLNNIKSSEDTTDQPTQTINRGL